MIEVAFEREAQLDLGIVERMSELDIVALSRGAEHRRRREVRAERAAGISDVAAAVGEMWKSGEKKMRGAELVDGGGGLKPVEEGRAGGSR
nr:hypothetical protein Itr_chr07CG06410 [Ipomoea trifida]